MATYRHAPSGLTANQKYRVDTGSANNTPATVTAPNDGTTIAGSFVYADLLGKAYSFNGTAQTLYLRPLKSDGTYGTAVTSTGVLRADQASQGSSGSGSAAGVPDAVVQYGNATYASLNLPGGFSATGVGTRRANFMESGGGFAAGSALADFHQRVIVKVPVATTRWRLRVINAKADGTAYAGAINVTGIYVGTPNPSGSNPGRWDGNFTATPTQALSAFALDSTAATATTTAWVTDPTLQFAANRAAMVSMGFTSAATSTARGCGQAWYTSGAGKSADAAVAAPGVSFAGNVQLNWQIEYEWAGTQPGGIVIGDSLTEGYYLSNSGSSLLTMADVWHQVLSQRTKMPVSAAGWFGSTTANWAASTTIPAWASWSGSGLSLDWAAIELGSNDANNSVALATFQANIGTIVGTLRGLGIRSIYLCTVAPRALTGTPETLRQSYNAWLRTAPYDTDGVIDTDAALVAAFGGAAANTGLVDSDNTHWTPIGHRAVGNVASPLKVA